MNHLPSGPHKQAASPIAENQARRSLWHGDMTVPAGQMKELKQPQIMYTGNG
jgi:hypothetical protein